MVSTMLLWNWLITPLYQGAPREAVVKLLIPVFLPFNSLKAGLNSALILGLYKPVVQALRHAGLVESRTQKSGSAKIGIYIFAGILLTTCILLLLVLQGKL